MNGELSTGAFATKKSKADYEGYYIIKSRPARMAQHNAKTWQRLEQVFAANNGRADFEKLSAASRDHQHGTQTANHPYQFVTYCIRRGWLQRVA